MVYTFYIGIKHIRNSGSNQAKIKKQLRNTGRMRIKSKLEKTVSHLTAASSGLLLLWEVSRFLRKIYETFKVGFDKILDKKSVSYKKWNQNQNHFMTSQGYASIYATNNTMKDIGVQSFLLSVFLV